jgi:hypothetical protein
VTSATGLGDVVGHLVNLSLGATEGTKLCLVLAGVFPGWGGVGQGVLFSLRACGHACPWSCGEVQQRDARRERDLENVSLMSSRSSRQKSKRFSSSAGRWNVPSNLLDNVTDESGALAEVTLGAGYTDCGLAGGDLL